MRTRRVLAMAAALLLPLLSAPRFAVAEKVDDLPKPTSYVSDFAGVLSPAAKAQIEAECAEVDQQAHAQIAVVTIKSLEGESIEEFATQLEDKWKVGPKATDKGILLILATGDHKYRFEVGYGLEGILPDGKTGDIGRSMVPDLKAGNYDAAVETGVNQVAQVIAADAGVRLKAIPEGEGAEQTGGSGFPVQLIIPIVIFLILLFFSGRGGRGGGMMWFLLGSLMGGGFGGGDRGRDGGFGGGGGGGFGGFGGGGSGGGGASGDW
ncbi:MAG: TPM domain-containing protein [Acidobacteriaceae bacterium]